MTDIRNVLVHRAAWAKVGIRSVGAGSDPAVDRMRMSDYHVADVELGPDVTREPRGWVAANLRLLCDAADTFVAERFR